MKKNDLTLVLLAFLLLGCHRDSKVTITYLLHQGSIGDTTLRGTGWIEYDSVRFSDGSWAVYHCNFAPQNSLVEFFDNHGRTIATCAQASECYPQYWIYNYDEEGRLSHLLDLNGSEYENETDEWKEWYGNDSLMYLTFRNKLNTLDYLNPDTARYSQMNVEYDKDGDAVKAYLVFEEDSICAPDNYKLELSIEPCCRFWESDINGGRFILKTEVLPKNENATNYKKKLFYGLLPVFEQEYKDGVLIKTEIFPDPSNSDSKGVIKIRQIVEGEHIYTTKVSGKNETTQTVWKNGLLKNMLIISPYGTVLHKETYSYEQQSELVVVKKEHINYKTNQLEYQSTSFIELSSIDKESEEMDVLNHYNGWDDYY